MCTDVQLSSCRFIPAHQAAEDQTGVRIVRLPAVIARVGLCRSSIYNRLRSGEFPKPVRLGKRAMGFVDREIDAWLQSAVDHRSSKQTEA